MPSTTPTSCEAPAEASTGDMDDFWQSMANDLGCTVLPCDARNKIIRPNPVQVNRGPLVAKALSPCK